MECAKAQGVERIWQLLNYKGNVVYQEEGSMEREEAGVQSPRALQIPLRNLNSVLRTMRIPGKERPQQKEWNGAGGRRVWLETDQKVRGERKCGLAEVQMKRVLELRVI